MRALILTHAPQEGPGCFGEVLRDAGASIRTVAFHEDPDAHPDLDGADLILSLGGPMGAGDLEAHSWLAREATVLAAAARAGRKVLGVCLGAQILARGLGAPVRAATAPEVGFAPITLTDEGREDPVLAGLKASETVLHWHRETFDLPPGCVRLASSSATENQAFRLGRHAYGLQFHLEVTREMLVEWLALPSIRQELVSAPAAPTVEGLLVQASEHQKRLRWLCNSVLNRLVNLI